MSGAIKTKKLTPHDPDEYGVLTPYAVATPAIGGQMLYIPSPMSNVGVSGGPTPVTPPSPTLGGGGGRPNTPSAGGGATGIVGTGNVSVPTTQKVTGGGKPAGTNVSNDEKEQTKEETPAPPPASTTTPEQKNELDYYATQRELTEKQKTDDLVALDRRRVQQRQEAAINNELLMKYLPQLNKANGLAGLGVSETANIDALSRYQTNLGNIEATHQQGVSDIERAYRSNISAINANERSEQITKFDNAYKNIGSGIFGTKESLSNYLASMGYVQGSDEYNELYNYGTSVIDAEESAKIDDKTAARKENALAYIDFAQFDTEDALDEYLNSLNLDEDDKAELRSYGMVYVNKAVQEKTEEEETLKKKLGATTDANGNDIVAAYSQGDPNNKLDLVGATNKRANLDNVGTPFYITVGDKELPVASGGKVEGEGVDDLKKYAKEGQAFYFDTNIYVKKNGAIYQIAPLDGASEAYNELVSYLHNGTAPTVDASPEPHKFTIGDPNSVTKHPDNITFGSEITYVGKNGKETRGKVYFHGHVDPTGLIKQKGIHEGEVYYDEYTDNVYTVLDGALWKIKS